LIDARNKHLYKADSYDEFKRILEETPGFVMAHWDGTPKQKKKSRKKQKLPFVAFLWTISKKLVNVSLTGKPSFQRVVFAKAY
jgi:prolyl-tRNA synthetase